MSNTALVCCMMTYLKRVVDFLQMVRVPVCAIFKAIRPDTGALCKGDSQQENVKNAEQQCVGAQTTTSPGAYGSFACSTAWVIGRHPSIAQHAFQSTSTRQPRAAGCRAFAADHNDQLRQRSGGVAPAGTYMRFPQPDARER